jgi:prepilin-type N-terminal cleavage/methylation domain-containing protein
MQKVSHNAFTLLEMIFVILISGILSIGTFKALQALYIRAAKAKAVTNLSLQSQIVLDQISTLLYSRIPNSAIGYDGTNESSCTPIEDILSSDNSKILEWLHLDDTQLIALKYSGFIDMNASIKPNLKALGALSSLDITDRDLIFAGSFDGGSESISTCEGAYGWHGNESKLSYTIASVSNDTIKLDETASDYPPEYIYEKYYLANGAFAVARGEDIDQAASCISDLNQEVNNNTLLLFYDFYPYQGSTYCADKSGSQAGKVSILSYNVAAFGARYQNDIIHLSIDMNKSINGTNAVHITKQKAVF